MHRRPSEPPSRSIHPLALVLAVLISLAALAPVASPSSASPRVVAASSAGASDASSQSRASAPTRVERVVRIVNRVRARARTCGDTRFAGVPPVRRHAKLERAAGRYARLMASRNFFSHTGPDGSGPGDRITRAGYRWSSYGENIAAGQTTPVAVVQAWVESPGHCEILMGRYAEIGVGYAFDADADYQRYWVLDLGTRRRG
ncbi:CAP domain-containing protein [Nocardioides sp. GXZ039]|uniref:CAP domain-containing protein n=1 Tax=Nocardioides sp. GXZ039 TaxID=3136018 RepID=UPI0030F3808F